MIPVIYEALDEMFAVEFQGSFSAVREVPLGAVDVDLASGRAIFRCGNQVVRGRVVDLERPLVVFSKPARDSRGAEAALRSRGIVRRVLRFDGEPDLVKP